MPEAKVKREVGREDFAKFLAWLSPGGGDDAGEAYERLRRVLFTFFANRRCTFPEDLADETINRVILKLSEEQIENRLAYCYGVARNVYRESLRKERKHLGLDDVQIVADAPAEQDFSSECLDRCLAELPAASQSLIIDYFAVGSTEKVREHQRISERLGLTQTALRMSVWRIKTKLTRCIQQCMGEGAVT